MICWKAKLLFTNVNDIDNVAQKMRAPSYFLNKFAEGVLILNYSL